MIEISEATMVELYVHGVGNKVCGDGVSFSEHGVDIDNNEMLKGLLMNFFFAPIKGDAYFNFCHATSLDLNSVYKTAELVFSGDHALGHASKILARLLYEVSDHPNIKSGELFVALFKDIICDGEVVDGLGIFKSESTQASLVVEKDGNGKNLKSIIGINPTSLDKACLVLNTESDFGYKVCVVDTSRNIEAVYWKEAFLQVKPREDSYYKTRTYLDVCKQFVKEVFNTENEVDPADRVDMLNRTAQYFKENEVFNAGDFESKVLEQPEIVEAFKDYKDKYQPVTYETLSLQQQQQQQVAAMSAQGLLPLNPHAHTHGVTGPVPVGAGVPVGPYGIALPPHMPMPVQMPMHGGVSSQNELAWMMYQQQQQQQQQQQLQQLPHGAQGNRANNNHMHSGGNHAHHINNNNNAYNNSNGNGHYASRRPQSRNFDGNHQHHHHNNNGNGHHYHNNNNNNNNSHHQSNYYKGNSNYNHNNSQQQQTYTHQQIEQEQALAHTPQEQEMLQEQTQTYSAPEIAN